MDDRVGDDRAFGDFAGDVREVRGAHACWFVCFVLSMIGWRVWCGCRRWHAKMRGRGGAACHSRSWNNIIDTHVGTGFLINLVGFGGSILLGKVVDDIRQSGTIFDGG